MIKEAAIQRKSDGKVWVGYRHSDIIRILNKDEKIDYVGHEDFTQGFVTDDGKFVDRNEAFKIALACGQLKDQLDPWAAPTLMSEDLY